MESRRIEIKLHKWFNEEDLNQESEKLLIGKADGIYAKLPATVDWCPCCNGSGYRSKYDVEGYDINEMMYEDGVIDQEFAKDYFGGKTDVPCDKCEGTKIQNIVDYDSCNEVEQEIVKHNQQAYRDEAEDRAYSDMERRMGA